MVQRLVCRSVCFYNIAFSFEERYADTARDTVYPRYGQSSYIFVHPVGFLNHLCLGYAAYIDAKFISAQTAYHPVLIKMGLKNTGNGYQYLIKF